MKQKTILKVIYSLIFTILLICFYIISDFLYSKYFPKNEDIKNIKLLNEIKLTPKQIEEKAQIIAKSSVIYLSNFAIEELKEKIELDFQSSFIEAIQIKDIYLNEILVSAYKNKEEKVIFTKTLPKKYNLYNTIKKDIVEKKEYTSNILGEVTIYYKDLNYYKKLINLTKLEQKFLKENSRKFNICVAPKWAPFEEIENENYKGVSSDILNIISNQLNIDFNLIKTNSWHESLENIKKRNCDVLPLAVKTEKRVKYLNFSKPYLSANIVVATKSNVPFFDTLKGLENRTFAVLKGHFLYKALKEEYKGIKIVQVDSIKEGLTLVEKEHAFAYIDNSVVINHVIQKDFIGLITVSGKLNGEMEFAIATRKDLPLLNSILNKALALIDKQTKEEIFNKWIKTNYQIRTDYTLVWQLAFFSFLIIVITLYWNRRLAYLNKQLAKQRNKAYEASKAKAKFLANMSHEIRTPMNSIIGISHLLLESNLKNEQREQLEKIDKSAKSLLRIINDILDFSKIEAGKIEFQNAAFKLREVIRDCVDYIDLDLEEKNLEFILEYDENLREYYFGDKLRVSQILTNILHNAVKFTNKGFIRLKIEQRANNIIHFEIEDSGIGLSKIEQNKIFDSFSQGDLSTSKKYEGTGLGLSICKDLIGLMNGKITLQSQKDIGTKFSIDLELKSHTKTVQKKQKNDKPDFSNKNILLVEDNKLNQDIIRGLLKDTSANLTILSSGKEAISLLKKPNDINLVLMDIQMPILDGYETSKIIREFNKDIPIIALTANTYEEDISNSYNAGMNEHLQKPIDIKNFYHTLKNYLS